LFFSSCQSQNDKYLFENEIYECLKKESPIKDIDKVLSDMEKFYLSQNEEQDDLQKALTAVLNVENTDIILPKSLSERFDSLMQNPPTCNKIVMDSIKMKGSRLLEIQDGFRKVYSDIGKTGDLNLQRFSTNLINVFTKEDLKNPFLKRLCFNIIHQFTRYPNFEQGIISKLPLPSGEEPDPSKSKKRNVLSVMINSKNEIFIRSKSVNISEVKNIAKEFISNPNNEETLSESPAKAIISLKNSRGTLYGTYLDILDELKAAYNELRNEKAQQLFGKKYEDLEKDQQRKIKKIIPLAISEAEPSAND